MDDGGIEMRPRQHRSAHGLLIFVQGSPCKVTSASMVCHAHGPDAHTKNSAVPRNRQVYIILLAEIPGHPPEPPFKTLDSFYSKPRAGMDAGLLPSPHRQQPHARWSWINGRVCGPIRSATDGGGSLSHICRIDTVWREPLCFCRQGLMRYSYISVTESRPLKRERATPSTTSRPRTSERNKKTSLGESWSVLPPSSVTESRRT